MTGALFREEPSGRLVLVPLGARESGCGIECRPEQERIRGFVKFHMLALLLTNVVGVGRSYALGMMILFCPRATSLASKLETFLGPYFIAAFASEAAPRSILLRVFGKSLASFTFSRSPVIPEAVAKLAIISDRSETQVFLRLAGFGLGILAVWGWFFTSPEPLRKTKPRVKLSSQEIFIFC